jgi:hypothetical protein
MHSPHLPQVQFHIIQVIDSSREMDMHDHEDFDFEAFKLEVCMSV